MPETFLNGGGPDYLGATFSTATSFLTQWRDTLTTAGWTFESESLTAGDDTVGQFVIMRANAITGGHQMWMRCIVSTSSFIAGGYRLDFQGAQTNFGTLSNTKSLELVGGGTTNRMWVSANEEAFCCMTKSFGNQIRGVHGGFLNRVEPTTDQWGYAVGYLLANPNFFNNPNIHYEVGKSFHNNTNWRQIQADFEDQDGLTPNQQLNNGGTHDRHTVFREVLYYRGFVFSGGDDNDASKNNFNGQINGVDGKAILGEYYVTEGFGSTSAYSATSSLGHALYYRGNVHFAVTGMSSLAGSTQVEDPTGTRYISTGGAGAAGFRITS